MSKLNLGGFIAFQNIQLTRAEFEKALREVLSMKDEYEQIHGKNEEQAKECAVNEIMEGMDAAMDLQSNGEKVAKGISFPNS